MNDDDKTLYKFNDRLCFRVEPPIDMLVQEQFERIVFHCAEHIKIELTPVNDQFEIRTMLICPVCENQKSYHIHISVNWPTYRCRHLR
jgi:hypothetical protein